MVAIRIKAAFGPHQKEAEIQSSPIKLAANGPAATAELSWRVNGVFACAVEGM
jgi:hypothetical protein